MPETEDHDFFSDCMEHAMAGADLTLSAVNVLESGLMVALEIYFPELN
jgi:hypothetical protein